MPFEQFPAFIATVNRCDVELGNVNHSKEFIRKYTLLLNKIIYSQTENWIKEHSELTITLDIGTCLGFTLVAVLLIKDKEVKLISIEPTASKKGPHLANVCFNALLSENVTVDMLKQRICGVVGDGAFMKGNAGFKNTLKNLLSNPDLQLRGDLLPLANCARSY